jgi:plastocyanin
MISLNVRRAAPITFALLFVPLLLLMSACAPDGDENGAPATTPPAGNGDGNGVDGGEVSFDVSMGDNFFEPNEFTVAPGTTVTFNITNDGQALHNVRIAGEDNEYGTDDDAVSDPELLSPGQEGTVTWTAPSTPGTYDFHCDIHPTDQIGTIEVE